MKSSRKRKKSKYMEKGVIPKVPAPKNDAQKNYINAIKAHPMVISVGPAGTGKSYLAACIAGEYLKRGIIEKIVITRPTIPTGKSVGYFPGDLSEKMAPWTKPIMDTLKVFLGRGDLECQIKNENIEVVPFETIRGRLFENAFIILDEAQNCTLSELKAFVTRAGDNSTVVINGDTSQTDIRGDSFRSCALNIIVDMVKNSKSLSKAVAVVEFSSNDIVRSGLCQLWVQEFDKVEAGQSCSPEFLKRPIGK